ncbi:MAG: TlpA disulfide reductase family protein [Ramlibacter sp.]|nr:TlpA disulfide reductase family protein [Ramlibacter sp.]
MTDGTELNGPPGSARRRNLIYAGVGAAAAVAGAGAALWKWTPGPVKADDVAALWAMNFETPDGASLSMSSLRGKPLVVNFWATWCPPCVEEMPLLDSFFRANASKSWQVVGLAIDQPSSVRKFLQKTPVTFPIGLAGMGGTELGKALGNLAGGLPFTVVLKSSGEVLQRKMGQVVPADLAAWAGAS